MIQEIKPPYVTFEQAKWLKEKEWNIKCKKYYNGSLLQTSKGSGLKECYRVYAPEQHQVVEWLLKHYDIWIVTNFANKTQWYFDFNKFGFDGKNKSIYKSDYNYDTPQEAYSAAFDYIKNNNLI